MKRGTCHRHVRHQRGVAAVEVALILPLLLLMLAATLFLGRVFYNYEVAARAAHDAAGYLATVPQIEFRTPGQASNEAALALAIVTEEIAALNPGSTAPFASVQCDGLPCVGANVPATIRVSVQLTLTDEILTSLTYFLTGDNGIALVADVTMNYVGK
jgi:Flp pilus assembly protein TadG